MRPKSDCPPSASQKDWTAEQYVLRTGLMKLPIGDLNGRGNGVLARAA